MRFEMLNKFIEQKEKMNAVGQEMAQREKAAVDEYYALKAEYESTITRQVIEGKDLTKQLDALADRIEKAKVAVQRRQQECHIFSTTRPGEAIKADDLVKAFNEEFLPAFHAEKMQPVLNQLIEAKKALADATLAYIQTVDEFEAERYACRSELSDSYYYRLKDVSLQTRQEVEKYFVTTSDLHDLQAGKRPDSLKGVE